MTALILISACDGSRNVVPDTPRVLPDEFTISWICETCDSAVVFDMNDSGVVAGWELVNGAWEGRLWLPDSTIDLGEFLPRALNNRLVAIGALSPNAQSTYLWSASTAAMPIPGLPLNLNAVDLDDESRMALSSGARFSAGVVTPLEPGPVMTVGRMNNVGDIAGATVTGSYWRALIWRIGSSEPVSIGGGRYGAITAINDARDAIGSAETAPMQGAAFYFVPQDAPNVRLSFEPRDLNEERLVVGTSAGTGMLWRDGQEHALSDLVASTGQAIVAAIRVDDSGRVLAYASGGRPLLLLPIADP